MKTNNQMQGGVMQMLHRFSSFSFFSLLRGSISNNCSLAPISYRFAIAVTLLFSVSAAQADQPETAAPAIKPGEYQYKLVMSHNDKVCRHMLKLYNGDLMKYGYEKYDEHPEFTAVPWKETVNVVRQEGEKKISRPMKAAYFDFNNDGKKELVIKDTDLVRSYDVDSLWIFENVSPPFGEISTPELRDARNKISPGACYRLTGIEPAPPSAMLGNQRFPWCEDVTYLHPFIFDDIAYIGISGVQKFLVIGKFKQGRIVAREDQAGVIEDVCYLERFRAAK